MSDRPVRRGHHAYRQGDERTFPRRFDFEPSRAARMKPRYLNAVKAMTDEEHETARAWMKRCYDEGGDPFDRVLECPSRDDLVHVPGVKCWACNPRGRLEQLAKNDDGDL